MAYPTSNVLGSVQKDARKPSPQSSRQRQDPEGKPHAGARGHEVAQRLGAQEPGKSIALHGLICVIFGRVKYFRIVPSVLFDGSRHVVDDALRQDNLSLRASEQVGVENLFRARSQIGSCHRVRGRVVGEAAFKVAAHEACPRRPFRAHWSVTGRGHTRVLRAETALRRMIGTIVCSPGAIFLAQKRRQMLVSASFFSRRGWTSSVVEVSHLIEDHGRALRAGFFKFWRFNEDGAAQVTDVMAAENEMLGDIEPVRER